jgi:hypothetical protein
MSMPKKRTRDFGKRGREQAEPGLPRVTVIHRLKTLGTWYLRATGLQRKAQGGKSAFKVRQQRP